MIMTILLLGCEDKSETVLASPSSMIRGDLRPGRDPPMIMGKWSWEPPDSHDHDEGDPAGLGGGSRCR